SVSRCRDAAEYDGREVILVETDKVGEQSSRSIDAEHEKTCRHGVERAGVADPARVGCATHSRHDTVARDAAGFVDEQDAAGHHLHESRLPTRRGSTFASSNQARFVRHAVRRSWGGAQWNESVTDQIVPVV